MRKASKCMVQKGGGRNNLTGYDRSNHPAKVGHGTVNSKQFQLYANLKLMAVLSHAGF